MPKIPRVIYQTFWLLFSRDSCKTDKDGRTLVTLAGLLLLLIAALMHTAG